MRETIDIGIELGNTGSAVAMAEDGGARVLRNSEGRDRTPSAVSMPRPGKTLVGRAARERVAASLEDAHAGFVLRLGAPGDAYRFPRAGVTRTAEQLAADVLKSLCRDAAHERGEPRAAAVITVPASFTPEQHDAARRAAVLAGLSEDCPLLPEPVAVALAYGADGTARRGHRLVFSLGSSGFTAALVGERHGELRLLGHVGAPHLGGGHIDRAIVDELLTPAVVRELGLRDFARGNRRWRTNFAKLNAAAEAAKIELSRAAEAAVTVDLRVDGGEETYWDYTLTRGALDDLARPSYAQAVALCRHLLAENALRPEDVDGLLLAGGATLAPGLRELLADPREGLGIRVDHSQDPTTVVARGAALRAGTVPLPAASPALARDEIAGLLRETRDALGRCTGLLDQAGTGAPGRLRAAVALLQETVGRLDDDLSRGGAAGWHTSPRSRTRALTLLRRLRDRLGELHGALTGNAGGESRRPAPLGTGPGPGLP
ncbi:Hsp70 family protein [Streptomyces sp. NBC_01808]|uniref:Hsp70 family protein n=1 Tax=Streptomyces sp. NBC_01808 TaxID=2975947 RepID=UPI002DD90D11|nr:Hsp70 family protein [Streptomyces sp. NBC_01808]WSA41646.1 Hsp70 family protein [Streptomyces sp. NBC_01808]